MNMTTIIIIIITYFKGYHLVHILRGYSSEKSRGCRNASVSMWKGHHVPLKVYERVGVWTSGQSLLPYKIIEYPLKNGLLFFLSQNNRIGDSDSGDALCIHCGAFHWSISLRCMDIFWNQTMLSNIIILLFILWNPNQEVKTIIKDNGFLVIQSKVTTFSQHEAEKFYEEHRGTIKNHK